MSLPSPSQGTEASITDLITLSTPTLISTSSHVPTPVHDDIIRPDIQQTWQWSFTHGFLLGQFSVIVILCAFLKFFIFGEGSSKSDLKEQRMISRLRKKRSSVLRAPPPLTTSTILNKTGYNSASHPRESLDWFNVLIAQMIAQFRDDARVNNAIVQTLDEVFNSDRKPGFVGEVKITELALGEEFPRFSNCRILPFPGDSNRLRAEMDVDLSDLITLGIETKLHLNYPRPSIAVLPVSLSVSLVNFAASLSVSFVPRPPLPLASAESPTTTALTFTFAPDFSFDISVRSLVGARSRLQDIPKISQLVESRVRLWFMERCVQPRYQRVVLPNFWPSRAKEGSQAQEGQGGEGSMADEEDEIAVEDDETENVGDCADG